MRHAQNHSTVISLDLELNHDQHGRTAEVIQVGYVIGNIHTGDILVRKCRHVKNQHSRPIVPFIEKLTGITNADIADGSPLSEIYPEMVQHMRDHSTFINPVTWGGGDSQELREAIVAEDPEILADRYAFGRRWIDAKSFYVTERLARGLNYQGGLKKACNNLGIQFVGPAHNALQDAENTFKVYRHYAKRLML
jgi:inhibitor of KinA sporulation pathway (predicted exonuclease)